MKEVRVWVDLDDFDEDEIIDYLENRGYEVYDSSDNVVNEISQRNVKNIVRYIEDNGDEPFMTEILYEYLKLGHYLDINALCEVLKQKLG